MEESSENVLETKKKATQGKYIIAVGIILLCIIAGLIFRTITWEQKPDPVSEKIIRKVAARQLDKDPNELTDQDFAQITELIIGTPIGGSMIGWQELPDIILLKKLTNLQSLQINYIYCPKNKIPKWMQVLAKFGLYDLDEQYPIDLSPLEKLIQLERLIITNTPIKNFKPIGKLTNLQDLMFTGKPVANIKYIKKLTKLKSLYFHAHNTSDLEAIQGLTNLKNLTITTFKLSSIEPVKELINLESLMIHNSSISDLEPVKALKNLKRLIIFNCNNISDEQIKDLQKILPDLYVWKI